MLGLRFKILILVWFLNWRVSILLFPVQCFCLLSWGRYPTPKQLRRERVVGYMALLFGILSY